MNVTYVKAAKARSATTQVTAAPYSFARTSVLGVILRLTPYRRVAV
jgi:hypothetical protein